MEQQSKKIQDLDELIKKIKPYLRRYLEERNIEIDGKGVFSCINPDHADEHPSSGFIKETNEEEFFCFVCSCKGDIFNAANVLEKKPLNGQAFIEENVIYLAEKYGIPYGTVELTPEELYIRRIYKAYEDAADIISEYQPLEYVVKRKWPITLCKELKIGSVRSYDSFITKMANRGYDKQFISDIDLNRYIFNEGMLVFSVRDERGRVVGFSARNMSHSKDSKKMKFINTSAKCPIYNKSVILYGLDVAKNQQQPLYIFEGYPDIVTAFKYKLHNSCAIGGTALTREHINLLKKLGIDDCILALDGDEAGQKRIESLLDNYFGGDETIRVRVLKLPALPEQSDPDDYIEKNGVEAFQELQKMTPFQWRLDRFSYDANSDYICDKMLPFVVMDPNEVHRETMAKELAERTSIRLKTILKQLDKLINVEEARIDSHVQVRIRQMVTDLNYGKTDPVSLLEITANEIRQIHSISDEDIHSNQEMISSMDETKEAFNFRKPGLQGWVTGFKVLDEAISGIPQEDVMITFAGDTNVGKTGYMFQLALNLAKNNDDIIVLFMSIDDSRQQAVARLVALESGLRINQVSHPQQNIKTDEEQVKLENGWRSLRSLVASDKFSLKDNSHGNTLDFAEGWIRWAKQSFPTKKIVFFLDNFHKLGDEWNKDERIRFKHASSRIHAMKNKLHFTAICTMEIRKLMGGQKNQRPILQDISESKQMEYDNNLIGMFYSDMHARRQDANIFWTDEIEGSLIKKPVIEVDVQKNKITEFKGALYYKFSPEYSRFFECSGAEVQTWKKEYDEALRKVMDKRNPQAGDNPFTSSSIIDSW